MNEDTLIEALKALAHPLRHRIMRALRQRELNVGEIEETTAIGQPALSQQLGVLRKAGLVETRKEAKLVYYRLDEDRVALVAEAMAELADSDGTVETALRTPSPGAANFARLS